MNRHRVLLLGGALAVAAGAPLPWLTVDLFEETLVVSGTAAARRVSPVCNGVVTAGLAALSAVLGLRETPARLAAAAAAGLVAASLAAVYPLAPGVVLEGTTATATSVRTGVFVTVAGGGCVVLGGVFGAAEDR